MQIIFLILCGLVIYDPQMSTCVVHIRGSEPGVETCLTSLTSLGDRMEMKSSYICRTFSSTTVLLVSIFSSSQASQNIMFSSLNSVCRNCLKQLRPAALFITLSNEMPQERASSREGFGLGHTGYRCYSSRNLRRNLRMLLLNKNE